MNTLPDTGRRRQSLNTKDHFWLVTARNKVSVDNWFKSLAGGSKSLTSLAKKVPVFNKREELLICLCENEVPLPRAVWFIKMTAAYALAMQETNKTKKRQLQDPSVEWTTMLVRFLKDQQEAMSSSFSNSSSSSLSASSAMHKSGEAGGSGEDGNKGYKYWCYITELCEVMYYQGLLDRQDFLQWMLDTIERYRHPDDPIIRLLLPLLLQYAKEFVKYELQSRKLAYHCAKKITLLVSDTEAISSSNGTGDQNTHPVMAAFLELMEDNYTR